MLRRLVIPIVCCLLGGASLGCASMSPRNMIPWTFETKQEKIDRLLNVARLYERHGQMDEATHIYEQVLTVDTKNTLSLHRLGVIAVRDGRLADAQVQFELAIASGKPSAELLGDMGYLQYLRHDLPAAEAQLRAALQIDPRDRRARNNLGLVLGEQERFDEALVEFRQGGSEAEALANLAYVQSQMGALGEAEKNYHQALDRDNTLRNAAEALVQLADMKAKLNGGADGKNVAQAQHNEPSTPVSQFVKEPAPATATPASFSEGLASVPPPSDSSITPSAPLVGQSVAQPTGIPVGRPTDPSVMAPGVANLPGLPEPFAGPRLPVQTMPGQPNPSWQAPLYKTPAQSLPTQQPIAPYTPAAPSMPAFGN